MYYLIIVVNSLTCKMDFDIAGGTTFNHFTNCCTITVFYKMIPGFVCILLICKVSSYYSCQINVAESIGKLEKYHKIVFKPAF